MRCLALAQALRDRGAICRFVCRQHPGHMLERIGQAGFEAIALPMAVKDDPSALPCNDPVLAHTHWLGSDWQTDASQTIAAISDHKPDWLVVDHYAIDQQWESQLRRVCGKIMVIDDLADRNHDCDLLLDQNLVANKEHRYDCRVARHCACLFGPRYALLQSQYAELHPRTPPRLGPVKRIMVYFGGADDQNLTELAINAFLAIERPDITLDVVINPEGPHANRLRSQVQGRGNITLHEGLPSLASLMVQADLAVGAAGATSWERCCLGLPTLVVTLADNQLPIADELDHLGLVRWLGDRGAVSSSIVKAALLQALQDENSLAQWSSRCQSLVDGQGAGRVRELLLLNSTTTLNVRPACLTDKNQLLGWANDPLTRRNAFNSEYIKPATHRNWLYKRLRNPENCQIYIIEIDGHMPIGQVRFERSGEGWEIDYGLVAAARERGLGTKLLQAAIQAFRQSHKGALVFGRVKSVNLASKKVFAHLGFRAVPAGEGVVLYHLVL